MDKHESNMRKLTDRARAMALVVNYIKGTEELPGVVGLFPFASVPFLGVKCFGSTPESALTSAMREVKDIFLENPGRFNEYEEWERSPQEASELHV